MARSSDSDILDCARREQSNPYFSHSGRAMRGVYGLVEAKARPDPDPRSPCAYATQFSSARPSMRWNSSQSLVTSVAPSARAWLAIHKSLPPIGLPSALSRAA